MHGLAASRGAKYFSIHISRVIQSKLEDNNVNAYSLNSISHLEEVGRKTENHFCTFCLFRSCFCQVQHLLPEGIAALSLQCV